MSWSLVTTRLHERLVHAPTHGKKLSRSVRCGRPSERGEPRSLFARVWAEQEMPPPTTATLEQAYEVVPTTKACLTDPDSPYCTLLREANSSRVMQSWKAAKLYDAYHQRGNAGGLHNYTGVFEPRGEQVRIANYLQKHYPVTRYRSVLEGGPGSCWVLRTLQAANYSVHGQELSRHAIVHNCQGLDVKHGFLKSLHFRSAS
eukprot:2098880-Prymnesium_polylepis.1